MADATPADIPIDQMTPEQATAELDRLSAAYKARQTAPNDPAARARDDPAWRDRLLAGHPDAIREFQQMVEAGAGVDRLGEMLAGKPVFPAIEMLGPGELPARELMKVVGGMKELGIPDPVIRQAVEGGRPITRELATWVEQRMAARLGDREWVARLLAGGHAERREHTILTIASTCSKVVE